MLLYTTFNLVATVIFLAVAFIYFITQRGSSHGILSAVILRLHDYRSSSFFHALARIVIGQKCPKGLPALDPIEKVSKNVWRILGMNPGSHTLQGTNTWLVGNGTSKILIDTGEDMTSAKYIKFLLETVFPLTNTSSISAVLLTHGHGDHLGGVRRLLQELDNLGKPPPQIYKRQIIDGNFPSGDYQCANILEGQCFNASENTEDIKLIAMYTPGHTDDHVCFILQEESSSSLFSGDCVLGCGTSVFDNLYEYMRSLESLRKLMVESKSRKKIHVVTTIYPGHGPVIRENALEKIDEYISHRMKREQEIYNVLKSVFLADKFYQQNNRGKKIYNDGGKINKLETENLEAKVLCNPEYLSSWEITSKVYGPISFLVKISAQWNVLHHLNKLEQDKKVDRCWPDLWKIKSS